jgi:hypothetical protein
VLLDHAGQARRFGDALHRCWEERAGGFTSRKNFPTEVYGKAQGDFPLGSPG